MKIIVLHDRYSNEPIVIRVYAINAIKKVINALDENNKEEYTEILVGFANYDVKEHIDVVMKRIKAVEDKRIVGKEQK